MQINKGLRAAEPRAPRHEGRRVNTGRKLHGVGVAGTKGAHGNKMRGAAGQVHPGWAEVCTGSRRRDLIWKEMDNQGGFRQ